MTDPEMHGGQTDYAMVIRENDDGGASTVGAGAGAGIVAGWKQLISGGRGGVAGKACEHVFRASSGSEYVDWALTIKDAIAAASARERDA